MKQRAASSMEDFSHDVVASFDAFFRGQQKRFIKEGMVPGRMLRVVEQWVQSVAVQKSVGWFFAGSACSEARGAISHEQLLSLGRSMTLFSVFFDISKRLHVLKKKDPVWQSVIALVPQHIPAAKRLHTAEGFAIVLCDLLLALAFETLNQGDLAPELVLDVTAKFSQAVASAGKQSLSKKKSVTHGDDTAILFMQVGMMFSGVSDNAQKNILSVVGAAMKRGRMQLGEDSGLRDADQKLFSDALVFHKR